MHSPYQMTVPCPDHNIQRLKDRVVIAKHYMYDEASGRSEDQSEELVEVAECLVEQCEFLDKKLYTRTKDLAVCKRRCRELEVEIKKFKAREPKKLEEMARVKAQKLAKADETGGTAKEDAFGMVSIGQEAEEYTLEEKASKERLREEEEADGSGKAARLDSSVN